MLNIESHVCCLLRLFLECTYTFADTFAAVGVRLTIWLARIGLTWRIAEEQILRPGA
jgi:hypothetical protein